MYKVEMDVKQEKKSSLVESEWIIVITLLLIMFSMCVIAKINAFRCGSLLEEASFSSHSLCSVVVDGEVGKPGIFRVLPGTPIKKVIRKSRPTPFSDLKKIDLNQAVEKEENIYIPRLTEISITVEGFSSGPKNITVPAGTRMFQLKKYIDLQQEGMGTPIKNRRILRDGDVIIIK